VTPGETGDHNLPVIVSGEKETYLAFLGYLRQSVVRKLAGVSEEDARRRLVASDTTLLGVVNHLVFVEVYWSQRRLAGAEVVLHGDGFELEPTDTVESVCHRYEEAGRRTDELVAASADLDQVLIRGRHGLTLRWMLAHLLEETARHAGHLDIVREIVDGSAGR
jgi:hypothetical protein